MTLAATYTWADLDAANIADGHYRPRLPLVIRQAEEELDRLIDAHIAACDLHEAAGTRETLEAMIAAADTCMAALKAVNALKTEFYLNPLAFWQAEDAADLRETQDCVRY